MPRGWARCWLGLQRAGGPGLHWVWGLWKLLAGSACLSGSDPLWPRRCPSAELGHSPFQRQVRAGAWQGHSPFQCQVRADQELSGSMSRRGDGKEAGFLARGWGAHEEVDLQGRRRPLGEDSWEKSGGRGRWETWAGEQEAGHRRGIREEQQESRVAPISEHRGQTGSAPRAKCTAGPGLAKPLFQVSPASSSV